LTWHESGMSLTSESKITDGFARTFVDSHFSNLSAISRECNRSLRNFGTLPNPHAHGVVSRLVGTAIDYRLRAYFRRNVHRSSIIQQGLRTLQVCDSLKVPLGAGNGYFEWKLIKNRWRTSRGRRTGTRLMASFERTTAKIELRQRLAAHTEERMCRFAVLFAYLDWIGRSPGGTSAIERMMVLGESTVSKILSAMDSAIVADVVLLSGAFFERHQDLIKGARKVVIGRSLLGSADVLGGADFDIIIDGCLFDFKTTLKPKVTTEVLRQLVGYWLLDYENRHQVETVAVLLVRQGHLQRFNIRDLSTSEVPPDIIRSKFRDGLRQDRASRLAQLEDKA
jgi:hypothetical protein